MPRTTLQNQHTGRVHGTNPGPRPHLSKAEEVELCDFPIVVGQMGFGKT